MHLRRMVDQDIPLVHQLELENFSPWSELMLAQELRSSRHVSFVMEQPSGRLAAGIVGWCCVSVIAPEAELLKLAVSTRMRRNGYGQEMLAFLEQYLRQRECETLFLEVRSENFPALNLYRKNGFFEIGRRCAYYTNPVDDAVVLQNQL